MARHEIVIHENTGATKESAPYLGSYIADVTATIVTAADVTKVRVDNAMDINEQNPMNLIHGKRTFRVAGFNMVLSDEGAAAFLQNSQGTTFPVTVEDVISKQLFTARTADLLEAGDYKLVVKSRGGDAEGPLQTSFRRVKYLRVEDPVPTITSAHSENSDDGHVNCGGEDLIVEGTNLDTVTQVELLDEDGNVFHTAAAAYADGKLTTELIYLDRNPPKGSIRVATLGGRATYDVIYDYH